MIYDTKNRLLIDGENTVKISKNREKLLIALSSMDFVTHEEMANYIYNKNYEEVKRAIRRLKNELKYKANLKIKVKRGLGYILETNIFFE